MTWKSLLTSFLNDLNEKNLKVGLRQEWFNIYPEEKSIIYNFLYRSRQHKLFLYLFAIDLQSQVHDLPWPLFLNLLEDYRLEIDKENFQELSRAIKQKHHVHIETRDWNAAIAMLIKQKQMDFSLQLNERKQELMASARIAESERLNEQHMSYLKELKKISPRDHQIEQVISEQEKERASHIITKKIREHRQTSHHSQQQMIAAEKKWLDQIERQAVQYLESDLVRAADLAYLFRSLGDMNKAIEFISSCPESPHRDWQLLNYLYEGRQFLASLDFCQQLREKYQENPDALFTICYIESLAYWELGEKSTALDLMNQIFEMRPDFKSAGQILRRWQEESFE